MEVMVLINLDRQTHEYRHHSAAMATMSGGWTKNCLKVIKIVLESINKLKKKIENETRKISSVNQLFKVYLTIP